MQLDPVLLEILSHKFSAIADEMAINLKRASRSVYVKEASDFSVGLVDLEGHIFAFPTASCASAIERSCGATIAAVPDLKEGDVILTNDPYRSEGLATHLPDLQLVRPYFRDGRIVAYGWCFVHFMDVGGRVPASISPSNSEIFQEGLIIPPLRIVREGRINDEILAMIAANCRTPEQNVADIKAMLGAMEIGGLRLDALIDRHGLETFMTAQTAVQDYAADKTRAVLRTIPDGDYEFWDYMDDDLVTRIPIRFRVTLTVRDGLVHVDSAGTDLQVPAAFNFPAGSWHPWLFVRLTQFVLTCNPGIPLNFGLYRHFSAANEGETVMNARFPDPVGVRHSAGQTFNEALRGALLMARPDVMGTPTSGVTIPIVFAEGADDSGAGNVTVVQPVTGGGGSFRGLDGTDARDNSSANMNNHPVETVEQEVGVLIREYDIRPDSAGPGEWRGGVGQVITMEALRPGTFMARGMDRMRFVPWGFDGGRPAGKLRLIHNLGRPDEREYGKIDALPVRAGDTVTVLTPGGGGYGDPLCRDPQKVARDVRLGFVSRDAAARDYGVILTQEGEVDTPATSARRAEAAAPVRRENDAALCFDFGAERDAWERVFDDATMTDLNLRLARLPKSRRQEARLKIMGAVLDRLVLPEGELELARDLADPAAARQRLASELARVFGAAG